MRLFHRGIGSARPHTDGVYSPHPDGAYNMVQDILIESDKDIKKHVTTYSGYARGSGALIDPDAFAQLTVTSAG